MKELMVIVLVAVVALAVVGIYFLFGQQGEVQPVDKASAEKANSEIKSTLEDAKKDLAGIREGLPT